MEYLLRSSIDNSDGCLQRNSNMNLDCFDSNSEYLYDLIELYFVRLKA